MALMQNVGTALARWMGIPDNTPSRASWWDAYLTTVTIGGNTYPVPLRQTLTQGNEERPIEYDYMGIRAAYQTNGVVFAAIMARALLFAEARFQFQELKGGRPGDLFGTPALSILERPEPGHVTQDLLSRVIMDADLFGSSYTARRFKRGELRLKRMRPDWTSILLGSDDDPDMDPREIDAEILGYGFHPGGYNSGLPPTFLLREEVAHFMPIKDPEATYRGMSWLTPVIREVYADTAATTHKRMFFENGATPNMVVKSPITDPVKFQQFVDMVEAKSAGLSNAYRNLYLGGGADATVVGANFQQIDFKVTQGAGETRIASAAGIHPVVLGLSEGLQGSSLNAGNFMAARRLTADRCLRPMWGNCAASFEVIVPAPNGSRLWYDDRHVPFLAEDVKDAADVLATQAQSIRALADSGFDPDSVVEAVVSGDLNRLKGKHSGLFSVQLQPPGTEAQPATPVNGAAGQPEPAPAVEA